MPQRPMPPTKAESRRVGEPAHDLVATRPGDSQITVKGGRGDLTDVVKTNTFVTDFDEFQKCGDVRMRYFGRGHPDQHHRRHHPPSPVPIS
jgi:hypothetical protein